jgi:hypothetical protein
MEGGLHCCGPGRGSLWKEIHGRPWAQWPETVGLQEEGFFFFFFNLKWIIVFTCDREGIMENFSHASCT